MKKDIVFVTGITGSVGSYLADMLIESDLEIYALVRTPENLPESIKKAKNIKILQGIMENIFPFKDEINSAHYIIHIATNWDDDNKGDSLNRIHTEHIFNMVDPDKIKRIIYFSTASILGRDNKLLPQAREIGTGYIKSKYDFCVYLKNSPLRDKVITIFPTMVIGGDKKHRYSHIGEGLRSAKKMIRFLRFFTLEGSFHFIHSKDIAKIIMHLMYQKNPKQEYVVGNKPQTISEIIKNLANYFGYRVWFQIKIPIKLLLNIAKIFRIQVKPWDKFCMEYKYFVYDAVDASSFDLPQDLNTIPKIMDSIMSDSL